MVYTANTVEQTSGDTIYHIISTLSLDDICEISTESETYENLNSVEIVSMPVTDIPFLRLTFDDSVTDQGPICIRLVDITTIIYDELIVPKE